MKTTPNKRGKMRGGVRRFGKDGKPTYTISIKNRPTQRCPACAQAKPQRRPYRWPLEGNRRESCPRCGGPLIDTVERWQATGSAATRDAAG